MFWPLALVVKRSVEARLRWSWWRRWHQAWARYYHYRRRERQTTERHPSEVDTSHAQIPQTEVTDVVWSRLEPVLPPAQRIGRP